ncbi:MULTISPECIES: CAF17-like 4Fe-4S cluster assembly/insertion protein YgfZ [Xanthomonas]|uniref:Aminomethyltransferase n=1 Tax=Xanthomonas cissicola TaxID=86186 RepID=A0ABX3LW86_9XANT|nr:MULTISPECIES: folate-binding protein YgfZ [Xanthomonas]OOW90968.1 aminomethyltransferase [Xanthomonas campestris pv. vitistrifoliae]OOW95781.1 aminomethyltransferase [Xanthomonas campestris pv. vitiscarnosae]KAB0537897.1 folate-binding protein YgfZ [Xanthomonas cissicola]OOW59830.1 aminomethyltransferase [Xanthomonas cissicola]OOW71719.1 aminomethyltransferase [Xanthomonas axonopodis pv. martyniicola]
MADNLNLIPQGFGSLHDMQYVRLAGTDAVAFAHAQFANDVQALAVGQWQWNAWLTAKGRVIAIFALLREDDAHLLMLLPDGNAAEIATQLSRFVFRRKLKIGIATLFAYGGFAAPEHAHAAQADIGTQRIELDLGSVALPRTLLLYSADALATPIELPSADAQWRTTDLQLGLARLVEGQREQWTPQQLALDRLQAYSVKKGCYPGQEIVARTHFLGKAKRALQLLETDAAVDAGDAVALDGSAIGTVVSVAGNLALAVLPLELTLDAGTALQAGRHGARPRALTTGLER